MTIKRAVAIGLLTITAIGLTATAVILSKKNDIFKPKVLQTNADYNNEYTQLNNNTLTYNTDIDIIYNIEYQNILKNSNETTKNSFIFKITPQTIHSTLGYANFTPQTATCEITNLTLTNTTPNKFRIEFRNFEVNRFVSLLEQGTFEYTYKIYIYNNNTELYTTENQYGEIAHFKTQTQAYQIYNSTETIRQDYTLTNAFTPQQIELFSTGNTQGYTNGETAGYTEGYTEGNEYGYQTGYTAGYQAKGDLVDGNFIDIRNMMLSVLTMPFTFIRQAFNVTMWEGTAYQFNVANFILSLIAIASILFIIRMFTTGFSVLGNYTGGITNNRLDRQQKRANIEYTKAQTANVGKPKEIHSTSDNTTYIVKRNI